MAPPSVKKEIKSEAEVKSEPKTEEVEQKTVAPPATAKKRKSRWDAEQPIVKTEQVDAKNLSDIEASVREAARIAAQLAATGKYELIEL